MAEKKVLSPEELAALYEGSVDDVPDLPKFPLPKPGVYRLMCIEQGLKDINDNNAHEFKYEVKEVLEEGDTPAEEAESCNPGDKFSQLYFMSTDKAVAFNRSRIKDLLKPVCDAYGIDTKAPGSFRQMCEQYVGCEVQAIVQLRQNKQKKEQWFPEVVEIQLT